jgi:hypothetical protein
MGSFEFRYSVIATRFESGEVLPVLVDTESMIPARLALRWVVRNRRTQAASKTVENNLRSLRFLYEWAASLSVDLDARLLAGDSLSTDERAHRRKGGNHDAFRRPDRALLDVGRSTTCAA